MIKAANAQTSGRFPLRGRADASAQHCHTRPSVRAVPSTSLRIRFRRDRSRRSISSRHDPRSAQCSVALECVARFAQGFDLVDFPRKMIEPDPAFVRRRCLRPDRRKSEIVMILRTRRAHKGHHISHPRDRLEPEYVLIKGEAAFQIAHPEHRMIESTNLHAL